MSVISSASLTLAVRVLLFALTLLTNIILARTLGPAGRGTYAIAVLVPTILALLASFGIGAANVYHVSRNSLDKRKVVAVSLALALAIGFLTGAVLDLAVVFQGQRAIMGVESRYLFIGSLSLPFNVVASYMLGVLQGENRFIHLNVVLLSQSLCQAVLLVVLLFMPVDRLTTSIAAWTVSAMLAGLLAIVLVGRNSPISLSIDLPTLKELVRYGSLTYVGTLTSFVNYRFDLLLVNVFAGATQVGLYAVGAGLAEVIWFLPNSTFIALAPTLAAAAEEDSSALAARATRMVLAVTLASALVMAVLAPLAIWIFFGQAFASSAVAVWLLLPGIVAFSAWKIMSCYLLGRNCLKQDLAAAGIAMVATVALDLALIPGFGFRGAAVASTIAYTLAMLVDLYWVTRRSDSSARRWLIAAPADFRPLTRRLRALRLRLSTKGSAW